MTNANPLSINKQKKLLQLWEPRVIPDVIKKERTDHDKASFVVGE